MNLNVHYTNYRRKYYEYRHENQAARKEPRSTGRSGQVYPRILHNRQLKLAYGMTIRAMYEFPQMAPYKKDMEALNAELEALG